MKKCPKCKASNPDYANYCGSCGSQMIRGVKGEKIVIGKEEYNKIKSDSDNIDFWVVCAIVLFLATITLLVFLIIKSVKLRKTRKENVVLVSTNDSIEQKYKEEHDYMVGLIPLRIKQMTICNATHYGKVLSEGESFESSSIVFVKPKLTIEGYNNSIVKAKCKYYSIDSYGRRSLIGTSEADLVVKIGQFQTMICGMGKGNNTMWKPGRYVADFYIYDVFVRSNSFLIK